MAAIYKIDDLRVLRSLTGAGVKDCKDALINAKGDIERAKDLLREIAKKKLIKKINRKTTEGSWFLHYNKDNGICSFIEVACETDFVAISNYFIERCNLAAKQLACNEVFGDITENLKLDIVQRVDENIQVGRCFLIKANRIYYKLSNLGKSLVILVPKQDIDISEAELKTACSSLFLFEDDFILKNENIFSSILSCGESSSYIEALQNNSCQISDKINLENINKDNFEIIVKLSFSFVSNDHPTEGNNNFSDEVMNLMKKYSE